MHFKHLNLTTIQNDLFECNDTINTKPIKYIYFYIISILGLIGNGLIFLFFKKKINPNSTNRAYIIVIAISDIVFILVYFIDTKYANNLQYNFICQLNNYFMNATKNLSAAMLLILVLNNLIRVFKGTYTLGVSTWYGQACSSSSIIFTTITVLALSYYNLWNKSLPLVSHANDTSQFEALCCDFVKEFNPQFTYKLENAILCIIYVAISILSVVVFVLFYLKSFTLNCGMHRDVDCERDMIISITVVAFITSVLQIAFIIKLFIELSSSLKKFESLMKSIEESHKNLIHDTDLSLFDEEIPNEIDHVDIEYLLLITFSFKTFIYIITMKSFRKSICQILRVRFVLNPSVIFKDPRRSIRTEIHEIQSSLSDSNTNPICSYHSQTQENRLLMNQVKFFSFKLNGFKNDYK